MERPWIKNGEAKSLINKAIKFVEARGNPVEKARLNFLLRDEVAPEKNLLETRETQNEDGGWSLPGHSGVSSLDWTCFQLAQLEEMGIEENGIIKRAFDFLISRQKQDGSFVEDYSLEKIAPPWARPGEYKSTLYLTSNCGFSLERLSPGNKGAQKATEFLVKNLNPEGLLPTFIHANLLAVPLLARNGYVQKAQKIIEYFQGLLEKLPAGQLVWLLNSWAVLDIDPGRKFINRAGNYLSTLQRQDGSFKGDDGENFLVHVTLGAIRFFLSPEKKEE